MSLEEARDRIACHLWRAYLDGATEVLVRDVPVSPAVAGRIGRRYLRALNDALRAEAHAGGVGRAVAVATYESGVFGLMTEVSA